MGQSGHFAHIIESVYGYLPQNVGGYKLRIDSTATIPLVACLSSKVTEYLSSLIALILAKVYFPVITCFAMTRVPKKMCLGDGRMSSTIM